MENLNKTKIDGLQAKIQSAYYLKDKQTDQKLKFFNKQEAYLFLKTYIDKIKQPSDIIIQNEQEGEIIINTTDKSLPLDRYVFINPTDVNIDDLTSNIKR